MKQFKVMFVCLGNICRSPAAQAVLEDRLAGSKLSDRVFVDSSGTDAYHVGEPSDSRMRQTASRHNVNIRHRAQQFRKSDFEEYDLVLAMDSNNLQAIRNMCRTEDETGRVMLYRDFDPRGRGDVPDPWYGGPEGFETVWDILERTTDQIISHIRDRIDD